MSQRVLVQDGTRAAREIRTYARSVFHKAEAKNTSLPGHSQTITAQRRNPSVTTGRDDCRLAEPSVGGSCWGGRLGEATPPVPGPPSLTHYAKAIGRVWGRILRPTDHFFVTFVIFCKPFRVKQKQTKETKSGGKAEEYVGLSYISIICPRRGLPLQAEFCLAPPKSHTAA